jgi:CRISPR-associated protein Csh2
MNTEFKNRVFGCIILKSINSNFNADFTRRPRTLPDGTVYSTDKALKYTIRDFFRKYYPEDKIFYVKRNNEETLAPLTLAETYRLLFGEFETIKKERKGKKGKINNDENKKEEDEEKINKIKTLPKLLECIDIRLFGATFTGNGNIGIHGTVQINHGVNRYPENEIYTEDILSPFPTEPSKDNSTIGNQTNLKEGHYVFHYSINPLNLHEYFDLVNKMEGKNVCLSLQDIQKLKYAFNNSVSSVDTTRKINTDNELTLWIQMKEKSRKMLPSLTELVEVERREGTVIIDLMTIEQMLETIKEDVELIEIYYNPITTKVRGLENDNIVHHFNILNNKEIAHEYEAHIG